MNASLNERLRAVKWGEFKLGDLFDINTSKSTDKNKISFVESGKYEFIGRSRENNGVQGKIDALQYAPNPADTFSISQIGETVCLYRNSEWYASQNIFILSPLKKEIITLSLFFVSVVNKALIKYSDAYTYPTLPELKNVLIKLPILNDGSIDFDFMESFIAELEAERVEELEAYLIASGLDNYELSSEEEKALKNYWTIKWNTYKLGDLYSKVELNNHDFNKREDVSREQTAVYNIPLVNAKHGNNGIMFYGKDSVFDSTDMTIDIVSNGAVSTGNVYPQPQRTGSLFDAYLIKGKEHTDTKLTLMFLSCAIQKSIKLKYSYENKATWNKVKDDMVMLPTKNGKPDYDLMETLISAIQKQVIRNVVLYSDSKIAATKSIVGEENKIEG